MNILRYIPSTHSSSDEIIIERLLFYIEDLSDYNISFESIAVIVQTTGLFTKIEIVNADSAMASLGYIRQ